MPTSRNGNLTAAELVAVSGTQLAAPAAAAFTRMAAACKAATGQALDIVNGGGGYRDMDYQRAMYENRAQYLPIRIAKPGESTHGLGLALDLTTTCWTPTVRDWCRDHCDEYGFAFPPANDPRHFLFIGTNSSQPASGGGSIPVTPEVDMEKPLIIRNETTGEIGVVSSGTYRKINAVVDLSWICAPWAPMPLYGVAQTLWFGFAPAQWEEFLRFHTGHNRAYWTTYWADDGNDDAVGTVGISDADMAELVAALTATAPTAAQIADAVNDDAAARLSS